MARSISTPSPCISTITASLFASTIQHAVATATSVVTVASGTAVTRSGDAGPREPREVPIASTALIVPTEPEARHDVLRGGGEREPLVRRVEDVVVGEELLARDDARDPVDLLL